MHHASGPRLQLLCIAGRSDMKWRGGWGSHISRIRLQFLDWYRKLQVVREATCVPLAQTRAGCVQRCSIVSQSSENKPADVSVPMAIKQMLSSARASQISV
jgi:hypothetical protein